MSGLSTFTLDELLAEIVRRRNGEQATEPIEHWCDDCAHFRYSKNDRDTANNCQKGHAMQFRVPEDYGDECGFYRRVCNDRAPRPVPPPPPRAKPAIVRGGQ